MWHCHLWVEILFFPFQFFADGDQGVPGAFVDAFIERGDMLEQCAKRNERLPGLTGEEASGGGFNYGRV